MPRWLQWLCGLAIVALLLGGPWWYNHYRETNFRNFHPVRDDVLFRSGQLSKSGLERVVHDHGIKTVVTLRDAAHPGGTPPDLAEESYCRKEGLNHFRLPPRVWYEKDDSVPAEENVRKFLEIMDNPDNYPVLLHCFAGSHRSGALCAIYRMEYEHWTNSQAIDEMKTYGYINLDDEWDILDYLENYKPRWQQAVRSAQEASEPPK